MYEKGKPTEMPFLRCLTLRMLALLLVFAAPMAAEDTHSRIKAEIERLQQSLKAKPISIANLQNLNSMIGSTLSKAQSELNAGRFYSSLDKLGQAQDRLYGAWVSQEKAESMKGGLPAFEAEWGKTSVRLTALDEQARRRNWSNAPVAVRALAETAQGKVIPLLDGSRGFATSTQPTDGLFYLGQAAGEANFSSFLFSLPLANKARPFPLRSFLPELQRLQEKTNAAFVPPRSIDLHPRFIALNSALKLAAELDAKQFYAGALYQYLEAVRLEAMLDAAAPEAARQTRLKDSIATALQGLEKSGRDDSIARIFLERAQSQLASAPAPDDWRNALVIVERVLPAYYQALKPAPLPPRLAGKTIGITLVRWPYT